MRRLQNKKRKSDSEKVAKLAETAIEVKIAHTQNQLNSLKKSNDWDPEVTKDLTKAWLFELEKWTMRLANLKKASIADIKVIGHINITA